jgi:hypothetical protein
MATDPDEYHLVTFDPGAAGTGYAHFTVSRYAFSRPEHSVLGNLIDWECGELTGTENQQIETAARLIWRAKFGDMPYNTDTDVVASGRQLADIVSEDFELTQMAGGKNLLSPVRLNAKLDWVCSQFGITLQMQRRTMRTNVTPYRLRKFGFDSPYRKDGNWRETGRGKDAFAAMQHGIVWLRRIKDRSRQLPWKISGSWDCACYEGKHCDLDHPS